LVETPAALAVEGEAIMHKRVLRRTLTSAASLLAAGAIALTGCAMVPSTGEVTAGLSDLSQSDQYVQFDPSGPVPGSSQEDIIRGFVNAGTSTMNDYAVAREFLTPQYATQWQPSSGVMIDDSSRPFRSASDNVGVLSVSTVATIDEDGFMSTAPPGPTTELRFELERVGNEWRISSAPAGIVLDRNTFTAVWSRHPIVYVTPSGQFVAEPRWLPTGLNLATKVVQALIDGPGAQLEGAAETAFPEGTSLSGSSVEIVDSQAQIHVSKDVGSLSAEQVDTISKQLEYSLQSITGVDSYQLLVDDVSIAAGSVTEYHSDESQNRPTLGMTGKKTGLLNASGLASRIRASDAIGEARPKSISVASDESAAALLTSQGVEYAAEGQSTVIDSRTSLTEPSIDTFGYVWTARHAADDKIRATSPDAGSAEFDSPVEGEQRLVTIRVSPRGNWIAFLTPSADGSEVRVAAITRDKNGKPTGISSDPVTVVWNTGDPVDMDWVDDSRIALLTDVGKSGKISVGGIGSFITERGSVANATSLSGTSANGQVRVLTRTKDLMAPQGVSGWQEMLENVDVLAKWG
jgi:hypothetical protein